MDDPKVEYEETPPLEPLQLPAIPGWKFPNTTFWAQKL